MEWTKDHVPAIVDAHYPGGMGGIGIVDVLMGDFNPCGRLTTTIYSKDMVRRSIFNTALRADGGLTYQHYDNATYGPVLFEFGPCQSAAPSFASPRRLASCRATSRLAHTMMAWISTADCAEHGPERSSLRR